jgi:hypothetical protein
MLAAVTIALSTFVGGIQKYFMAGLLALLLLTSATTLSYRAFYQAERTARTAAEQTLREAHDTIEAMRRTHEAQVQALMRADAEAQRLAEQRRTARERVLNAPSTQDGPVSPVLRCAVAGVCP